MLMRSIDPRGLTIRFSKRSDRSGWQNAKPDYWFQGDDLVQRLVGLTLELTGTPQSSLAEQSAALEASSVRAFTNGTAGAPV